MERYCEQLPRWPAEGRHILASYDAGSIVVYQAYSADIADYAVAHQRFGGRFSFGRMSWIKPNFLWMMFRSGWATKEGQERILAVRLSRAFFDELLARAVPSSVSGGEPPEVRLQWDPDHDPEGTKQQRRALQLGLRGESLRRYATAEVRDIADITAFVAEQRASARDRLLMPREDVYLPADRDVRARIGLDD
jgi:hypothetical protein